MELQREFFNLSNLPEGVSSILIGGSQIYAADYLSDLDIGIIWKRSPSVQDRRSLLACFSGYQILNFKDDSSGHTHLGRSDNIVYKDKKIDLIHITVDQIQQCYSVLQNKSALSLHYQALFWNLKAGQYIFGPKFQVSEYPSRLKELVFETQLPQIYVDDLQLALDRRDEFFFYSTLTQILRASALVFLARHEQFFVSFKQIKSQLKSLKNLDDQFYQFFSDISYEMSAKTVASVNVLSEYVLRTYLL